MALVGSPSCERPMQLQEADPQQFILEIELACRTNIYATQLCLVSSRGGTSALNSACDGFPFRPLSVNHLHSRMPARAPADTEHM